MVEKTKKGDFVEIKYTGLANNEIFDSNIDEDLKKLNPEAKPFETIVVIGEKMVVPGLDRALEDKELNKEYQITFPAVDGFGPRRRELVRIIPLKAFHEQKIDPRPGMSFVVDNQAVKVIAVSGARVTVDFNNPLAGKEISYKFSIVRIITDVQEKSRSLLKQFFRESPEIEVKDNKVIALGPKNFEFFINAYKDTFKKLVGYELDFKEVEPKKEESKEDTKD